MSLLAMSFMMQNSIQELYKMSACNNFGFWILELVHMWFGNQISILFAIISSTGSSVAFQSCGYRFFWKRERCFRLVLKISRSQKTRGLATNQWCCCSRGQEPHITVESFLSVELQLFQRSHIDSASVALFALQPSFHQPCQDEIVGWSSTSIRAVADQGPWLSLVM